MKIIVGSGAAHKNLESFKRKYGSDIDAWTDNDTELEKGKKLDYNLMPQEIMLAFQESSKVQGYATLDDLYTIKLSHLPYDIFWHKHKADAMVFKMKYGAKVNQDLYALLKAHWKEFHGNKPFLSLYRTKDAFFDDYVPKEYDHDYLHELVAYPNAPVYTKCLKDGQQVAIDKSKFDALPFTEQVKMFREEITVIANERWILNPACRGKIPYLAAWGKSVHKTVTALTKGWASEFICENLEYFEKPNRDEVRHLHQTLGI